MKRSLEARKPARIIPLDNAETAAADSSLTADANPALAASKEKSWDIDGTEGIPAPVIRANTISFRVSYQGRIQVAFFEAD